MRDYSRSESNEYDEDEDDGMEDLAEEPKELPEVRGGEPHARSISVATARLGSA